MIAAVERLQSSWGNMSGASSYHPVAPDEAGRSDYTPQTTVRKPHIILRTLRQTKRIIVIVVGTTVLLVGVAMIALPGPAFIVIPLGLGILATEVVWARKLLDRIKRSLPGKERSTKNAK